MLLRRPRFIQGYVCWSDMGKQVTLVRIAIAAVAIFLVSFAFHNKWGNFESQIANGIQSPIANGTVTVITAYYDIPSKKPRSEYLKRMENFLPQIPCNLYIYTSRADYPTLSKLRKSHLPRTKFIVKEFTELQEARRMELWKQQHKLDREKGYHSPELYIIWAEKIHMVMETIRDNVFGSEYFIWCDIGSFRNAEFSGKLASFPDEKKTAAILKVGKRILFNGITLGCSRICFLERSL